MYISAHVDIGTFVVVTLLISLREAILQSALSSIGTNDARKGGEERKVSHPLLLLLQAYIKYVFFLYDYTSHRYIFLLLLFTIIIIMLSPFFLFSFHLFFSSWSMQAHQRAIAYPRM